MASRADRFAQFTGAFDDPIAPSPAFAARLRARVLTELAPIQTPAAVAPNGVKEGPMVTVSTVPPTPVRRLRAGQRPRASRYLRWTKPMALVNVAAILLLLVGIVHFFAPDKPAPDSTYRLPAIASQTTGSPVAPNVLLNGPASMWGANPGRTWELSANPPNLDGATVETVIPGRENTLVTTSFVAGNQIFLATEHLGMSKLTAYDLTTGAKEWEKSFQVFGTMAAQDGRLYVILRYPSRYQIQALSMANGHVLWSGAMFKNVPPPAMGLLPAGGVLYSSNQLGQVLIIDARTGRTRGTLGGRTTVATPSADTSPAKANADIPRTVDIARDQDRLYVVNAQGALEAYRLSDNKLDWTTPLPTTSPNMIAAGALLAVGHGVVVTQAMEGTLTEGDNPKIREPINGGRLSAFDAATGKQLWSLSRPTPSAFIVTANAVVSPAPAGQTDSYTVQAVDLHSGKSLWQTADAVGFDSVHLSSAGNQIYALAANDSAASLANGQGYNAGIRSQRLSIIEDGKIVRQQKLNTTYTVAGSASITSTSTGDSAQLHNGALYIVNADGSVVAYGPSAAMASPEASPIASPSANALAMPNSMWGANPGQTWQFSGAAPGSNAQLTTLVNGQKQSYVTSSLVTNGLLVLAMEEKIGADDASHLVAYDLATGAKRWAVNRSIAGNPAALGDLLFVVHVDQGSDRLVALNSRDGSLAWTGPTLPEKSTTFQGPLLANGKIYLGLTTGQVMVVEPTTGKQTGTLGPAQAEPWKPKSFQQPAGRIAIGNGAIYITTSDGQVAAYSLQSNERLWTYALPKRNSETVFGANVAVSNGTVVIESTNGTPGTPVSNRGTSVRLTTFFLTAVDANSGKKLWSGPIPYPSSTTGGMVITQGHVIIAYPDEQTGQAKARAYNLTTGSPEWDVAAGEYTLPPDDLALSASENELFVIVPDQTLTLISLKDRSRTQFALPHLTGPLSISPQPQPAWLDHGLLYAVGSDGAISVLGQQPASATPKASPIVVQPGADPGQTFNYGVAVGIPKSTSILGTPLSGGSTGGGIIDHGTLYRIHIPADTTTGKTWSVEAVSLADGTVKTVFTDPKRNATHLFIQNGHVLVVSNPIVGLSTDSTLTAVDTKNQGILWSLKLFDDSTDGAPLLLGEMLFVPSQHGRIVGVDLTRHKWAWTSYVPVPGNPPISLAADARSLYAASGYFLTALDPRSGAISWQLNLADHLIGIDAIGVAGGHIVLAGTRATGQGGTSATPGSTPAPSDGSAANRFLAISTANHAVEWNYDTLDHVSTTMVFTNGNVLIGLEHNMPGGQTMALDLATGRVAWQSIGSIPVFAGTNQVVGVRLETRKAPGESTPIAGPNHTVFQQPSVTRSITFVGIDPNSGATAWSLDASIGDAGPTAALPFDGGIAVPLSDGRLLVLHN